MQKIVFLFLLQCRARSPPFFLMLLNDATTAVWVRCGGSCTKCTNEEHGASIVRSSHKTTKTKTTTQTDPKNHETAKPKPGNQANLGQKSDKRSVHPAEGYPTLVLLTLLIPAILCSNEERAAADMMLGTGLGLGHKYSCQEFHDSLEGRRSELPQPGFQTRRIFPQKLLKPTRTDTAPTWPCVCRRILVQSRFFFCLPGLRRISGILAVH